MQDMTGGPVSVGDFVIDERGRTFEVRDTDPTVQAQVIYTYDIRLTRGAIVRSNEGFVREGFCLKVDRPLLELPIAQRIVTYQEAFRRYRAPRIQQEIADRRATINAARAARFTRNAQQETA